MIALFTANVEPAAPQSVPADYRFVWSSTSQLTITCKQKNIFVVSVFTSHNEPVCIFGCIETGLKASNMISVESSVCCHSVATMSFRPKCLSMALFGNLSAPAIPHSGSQGELQGTTHDS